MLTSRRNIILLAVAALAVFASGAAVLLSMSRSDGDGGGGSSVTSDIWKVGDTWTVQVKQDAASISPDTKKSTALIPYRFEVESAPKSAKGEWLVRVHQDGAEGPFADGWRLAYSSSATSPTGKDCGMSLVRVGAGNQKMIESTVASIVLGTNFPYETCYSAPPKDQTLDSKALAKRSALPPVSASMEQAMTVPKGQSTEIGATPPKDAPVLGAGELPPGAPSELATR